METKINATERKLEIGSLTIHPRNRLKKNFCSPGDAAESSYHRMIAIAGKYRNNY
jgi:hypothetical protein